MKIFKFGGASVKDAPSVLNVAKIINTSKENLVVVVSAIGKTTNLIEKIVKKRQEGNEPEKNRLFKLLYKNHKTIVEELGLINDTDFITLFENTFYEIEKKINEDISENYNFEYDKIVSFGEVLSTIIISGFLNMVGVENHWLDARRTIRTNSKFREAKVDWKKTKELINKNLDTYFKSNNKKIVITQGFIGHTETKQVTTLGREGSDFSASIFAWCLDAKSVTIWKDVPGMLNADPKFFNNCIKLDSISFKEAIELSYYGASVIHPKTIKPIQNKNIPLYVKSFLSPKEKGTIIHQNVDSDTKTPLYIFKAKQTLFSFTPKDFSFVDEKDISNFFYFFANNNVRVNIIQNSAISFSICIDNNDKIKSEIIQKFNSKYVIKYNTDLELLTIRHYDEKIIAELTKNKTILVEQKSRQTARYVMI